MSMSFRKRRGTKTGRQHLTKVPQQINISRDQEDDEYSNHSPWVPGSYIALKALLSARLCSAIWGLINDCDETYNYWEPTHYLLYKKGFQTWEYSPEYAIRSYAYLLIHAVPAYIYNTFLQSNRMLVFFFIRCLLALLSASCELYFYRGICKEFGANVARIYLVITVFSAGLFIASTAYLPSSFSMYMIMLAYGAWFHKSYQLSIFTTALSVFLGWPFAIIAGLPIAFDILFLRQKFKLFFKWSFISAFTILMPMIQIDSLYFGKFVIAPLQIVLYNLFTSHGPDLYGTSPFLFYFANGFLNFNFMFFAALLALPLYILLTNFSIIPRRSIGNHPTYLTFLAFYLLLAVFSSQSHKEERFLFPAYPFICLAAAFCLDTVQKFVFGVFVFEKKRHYLSYTNWLAVTALIISSSLSVSRIIGQYKGYHAPFEIFMELNRIEQESQLSSEQITVCLGREWHRYPSSFFLPNLNWKIEFIESEFRGQLPQHYSTSDNGTSIIPPHMNDLNKEESSRYVSLKQCHFLIDLDKEDVTYREPRYSSDTQQWHITYSVPFLNNAKSPTFFRAFYIPYYTEQFCSYVDYVILLSNKLKNKLRKR